MMNTLKLTAYLSFSIVAVGAQSLITNEELVNASINASGELKIVAANKSSVRDFDFLEGTWDLHNKRLKTRLNHCSEWIASEATVNNRILLNGVANVDICKTFHAGTLYETLSLRIFNPQTRLWSLYWVNGKNGIIDPAVVGSFEGDIGTFYGKTIFDGVSVMVKFKWNKTNPSKPEWSQAYSIDKGKTWEWNSSNVSHRKPGSDLSALLKTISTDSLEFNAAFSPDGKSFYFSRAINKQTRIFVTQMVKDRWSVPEPVSFSTTKYSDADPAFSPAGELYFISNRPLDAQDSLKDYDIWKVTPISDNRWSEPVNVKELNSAQNEFYISFTKTGDAYFASSRDGGYGEEDIYYCENKNNRYGNPKNLGEKINSIHSEYDPFVASDGVGLIFTSSGRKDSFGKGDLYWSTRTGTGWHEAIHFGQEANTPTRDFCPYISLDKKYFFYSSEGDVKFISIEALPEQLRLVLKN